MVRDTPYSAVHFIPEAKVNPKKWNTIPSAETIDRTVKAIEKRAITVIVVDSGEEALRVIKSIIPHGVTVMSGSSTTLIEIGFEDFVAEGESGWKSLREEIFSENDEAKRTELRRKSVSAEYFVSSANAIASTGEIVACDASGSRVGAWPFAARHLILVVGINKIVPTLHQAFDRIKEYAYPLEDVRARRAYGPGSMIGKCVVLAGERNPDRTTVILVKESLGY
jgi:L-lactate utilization protein LutB